MGRGLNPFKIVKNEASKCLLNRANILGVWKKWYFSDRSEDGALGLRKTQRTICHSHLPGHIVTDKLLVSKPWVIISEGGNPLTFEPSTTQCYET